MRVAPEWFQRELRLLHPSYFAIFNPKKDRWQIRSWNGLYYRPDRLTLRELERRSDIIHTVALFDALNNDIGYVPLDQRALVAVRAGRWHLQHLKQFLPKVDEHNAAMVQKAEMVLEDTARRIANSIYSHYFEPRVSMAG